MASRIRSDLDDKKRDLAAFVSIRLHTGTNFWRLRAGVKTIDLGGGPKDVFELYEPCDATDRV